MRTSWGWAGPRRKKSGQGGKSRSSWELSPSTVQGISLAKAGKPRPARDEAFHSSGVLLSQLPLG